MRKTLLATTALAAAGAFAAGPVLAADMMSLGVGGYMEQWIGVADRADEGAEGGADMQSDSEIFFTGKLEADNGLTFAVDVQLEGNDAGTAGAQVDESFVRIGSGFGQVELGARDHGMVRMHNGIKDAGVGLNAGDTQKWIPGTYLETSGHAHGGGDDVKVNYFSPRLNGLQVGFSYAPDQDNETASATAPDGNDNDAWGIAVNYAMDLGDSTVSLSAGHLIISQSMDEAAMFMTGDASGANSKPLTLNEHADATKAVAAYKAARDLMAVAPSKDVAAVDHSAAMASQNALTAAMDGMTTKIDNKTFTNVGIAVGFGAFSFNVAYATQDGGQYKAMDANVPVKADGSAVIDTSHSFDPNPANADKDERVNEGDAKPASAGGGTYNDLGNDHYKAQRVVKDGSADFDVWGVSVLYSDGPMAVSLAHMTHSDDAGGERTATMLSGSYNLAPGVSWRTSVFGVEDTTSHKNVTGGMNEGTAFVTGIKLSF